MTSLATLNPFAALLSLPDAEAGGIGFGSQFAALLGQNAPTSATLAKEGRDLSAPLPPNALPLGCAPIEGDQAPALALAAKLHLPEGGKILPPSLPPMAIPARVRMHTDHPLTVEPGDAITPGQSEPETDPSPPPAILLASQVNMVSPVSSLQTMALERPTAPSNPEVEPDPAPPQPARPPLAASPPRHGRADPRPAYSGQLNTAAPVPSVPVLPITTTEPAHRPAPRPQPVADDPVPVALAVPVRQLMAATRHSEDAPQPVLPGAEPVPPPLPAESRPGIARLQPELSTPRPHDFGLVVDRLLAAREAGQSQAVTLAIPHAEFGRVALRFHHGDSGLSISLASPDPDFARAAAQALPPAQPVASTAANGPNETAAQPDRQQASPDLSGQSRHPGREPRSDRADQRQPGQAPLREESPTDRRSRGGIFA